MGNSLQKKRLIKVSGAHSRITKQELLDLKEAFNRIQTNQLINEEQFRLEVLGPQVPETIAQKLFLQFASEESNSEMMNFEDLLVFYIVFKHGKAEEMGQVCYELMKMTTGSDFFARDQINLFAERIVNVKNEQVVHSFYAKTGFDPNLPIQRQIFIDNFKKIMNLPLFTWVPQLVEGYNKDTMNMDESKAAVDMTRRLTLISTERVKSETEKLGFDSSEIDNMQEFCNNEMRKNDAKQILQTVSHLFKDIRNSKLRKYFIEELTKHKVLDFSYLSNLVFLVCKESDPKKKIEFLFDLFSLHTDSIKKKQLRDFAEIFDLGPTYFSAHSNQISKEDFLNEVIKVDFGLYESCKFSFYAMMALKPDSDDSEREAILSSLNYNHNIEAYINDHLEEEEVFYVIQKHFFDGWSQNAGFSEDKSFVVKKEKIDTIDNMSLIEPLHEFKLKEVTYNQDFILVPKYVFFPFSKWYKCNKTIERKVIQYKNERKKALTLFKQKKIGSSAIVQVQHTPDNFYKVIGDVTYELEIYPKFIYYEKINEKGEKPHQKAIVNQKIDTNYLKKVLKSDKLPLYELLISRKATFEEVLRQISLTLKENIKRGRLWIEDQVISGSKLEETLEEFGISMGQVVYVEYANANNQWPTDNKVGATGVKPTTQSVGGLTDNERRDALKTCGLYNLGNTCYMNSALQCLANTRFFYEYFVREEKYGKQMNLKSKHGFQGELAKNFAELMQKMWKSNQTIVPRNFKNSISQLSEQFQGYDQQDSQEFLAFLLDGLHEELNLRIEKPYMENPDSDDRKIVELGLEHCIPLSLPEPSKILLNVIVYRLPNELKDLINGDKSALLKRLDSQRSEDAGRVQSHQGERGNILQGTTGDSVPLNKFQESYKYITNDQPIHISLRVDKDIKISQLMQMICDIREVNIDINSRVSNLVLYSQLKGIIRGIFNPDFRLLHYSLITNEVEAIEVLTRKGREVIRDYYKANEYVLEQTPHLHLTSLLTDSEKPCETQQKTGTASSTTPSKKRVQQPRQRQEFSTGNKIDKCNLFNSYQVAKDRFQEFEDNGNFPEDIYVVAYHRRFVKKAHCFFSSHLPQLLSSPLLLAMPVKPSGKRIYEEIWAIASTILKKNSIYHVKKNRWWEQPDWLDKVGQKNETFKPFVLKTVDRSAYQCSQCDWMQMCSGCILPPTEEFIEDFFRKCHLAIEWHSSLIEEDYNHQANEVLHHSSTQDKEIIDEDYINLEDCLRKFIEVEEISSTDQIYCSTCRKPQGHLKKLEIFRPPPILIIQLKRFRSQGQYRTKINTLVEFPLYNLDLTTFVTDQEFLQNQLNIELKYDLYAIVNHYGTLYFGHYVSIIKNLQENKWYKYDDSMRTPIPEESLQKESAYILFYIRKDITHKSLNELFPSIKDFFPGKPIKTEKGDCFIISKETEGQDKYKVQYGKGKDTQVIGTEEILDEKDNNEIHYDAKDMQEIENRKKEKSQEIDKRKRSRMCSCIGRSTSFQMVSSPLDLSGSNMTTSTKKSGSSTPTKKKRSSIKSSISRRGGSSQCYIY